MEYASSDSYFGYGLSSCRLLSLLSLLLLLVVVVVVGVFFPCKFFISVLADGLS